MVKNTCVRAEERLLAQSYHLGFCAYQAFKNDYYCQVKCQGVSGGFQEGNCMEEHDLFLLLEVKGMLE